MSSTCKTSERSKSNDDARAFYPVVIIGAGAAGIAMGCRLVENLKFKQFKIFDRQSGVGGTWWVNRYPGVECDVPTPLYSFSFAPNYVSKKLYPSGKEFVGYLNRVVDQYGIADKIQLNTDVTSLRYIESEKEWEVTLSHLPPGSGDLSTRERLEQGNANLKTEKLRAKIVISCVGILVEPKDWPEDVLGLENFQGDVIHSSRWNKDISLHGKDIVVVGSGCSAAQIVPSLLTDGVNSVTQVMKTPPWVVPRLTEPFGEELYSLHAPTVFKYLPFLGFALRSFIYFFAEILFATTFRGKGNLCRNLAESASLKHMRSKVPDKYQEMMTPKYSYGCKRRVFDNEWLESMSSKNFTLTTQRLKQVSKRSILLGDEWSDNIKFSSEVEYPADVIVLANGFKATKFLHPLLVSGRKGIDLNQLWNQQGGPQAYMGTAIEGFPNFFMIVGPNTFLGHTSVLLNIESTVNYVIRIISPVLKGKAVTVEPKEGVTRKWTQDIQRDLNNTVFTGCGSWYKGADNYNSTMYPRSQIDFRLRCRFPRYKDWITTYFGPGNEITPESEQESS